MKVSLWSCVALIIAETFHRSSCIRVTEYSAFHWRTRNWNSLVNWSVFEIVFVFWLKRNGSSSYSIFCSKNKLNLEMYKKTGSSTKVCQFHHPDDIPPVIVVNLWNVLRHRNCWWLWWSNSNKNSELAFLFTVTEDKNCRKWHEYNQ